MSWKDTFRWVKEAGRATRLWLEETEHSEVELSMVDQMDSVSLQLEARTKGSRSPDFRTTASIRISYQDLVELVHQGQEILVKHSDEVCQH